MKSSIGPIEATKQLVRRLNPFPATEGWRGPGTEERYQFLFGAVEEANPSSQVWFLSGREVEELGVSTLERKKNLKTKVLRVGHGPTPAFVRKYPVEKVYEYLLTREVKL